MKKLIALTLVFVICICSGVTAFAKTPGLDTSGKITLDIIQEKIDDSIKRSLEQGEKIPGKIIHREAYNLGDDITVVEEVTLADLSQLELSSSVKTAVAKAAAYTYKTAVTSHDYYSGAIYAGHFTSWGNYQYNGSTGKFNNVSSGGYPTKSKYSIQGGAYMHNANRSITMYSWFYVTNVYNKGLRTVITVTPNGGISSVKTSM